MDTEDGRQKIEDRSSRRPAGAPPLSPSSRLRPGFSFTEILFAIMILGIGFIMVAAMFPVAIQQTETSRQETVGAAIARQGVAQLTQLNRATWVDRTNITSPPAPIQPFLLLRPTVAFSNLAYPGVPDEYQLWQWTTTNDSRLVNGSPNLVVTPLAPSATQVIAGDVWSVDYDAYVTGRDEPQLINSAMPPGTGSWLGTYLWSVAAQNMIQSSDSRLAWVAFYRRDMIETATLTSTGTTTRSYSWAPSAQLIVIATQSRNKQFYTPADVVPPGAGVNPGSLYPTREQATITAPAAGAVSYQIQFAPGGTAAQRAAEGAFVIIATDSLPSQTPLVSGIGHGSMNGHVYRLGTQPDPAGQPDRWEFAPGFGPSGAHLTLIGNAAAQPFWIYIIGRGLDADNPAIYSGLAQDIAVYSTFIPCGSN